MKSGAVKRACILIFESDKSVKMKKKRQMASGVIVRALSDTPLRIVQFVRDSPVEMLGKMNARYASETAASNITMMTKFVTIYYTSLKSDISKHIDMMAATVENFRGINEKIQESFAVAIFVTSVEVPSLRPATTALKTFAEDDLNW